MKMEKIDREKWLELASDYVEGLLSVAETEAVEEHLRANPESRREAQSLRSLWQGMTTLPQVEPPLYFRDNLISRIEHTEKERLESGWQNWLPRWGRLATGTLAAAGAGFVFAWMVFQPSGGMKADNRSAKADTVSPLVNLLPGKANTAPAEITPQPRLNVARVVTLTGGNDLAYDFSLWIENSDSSTVRVELPDDGRVYRFVLRGGVPHTVRVPFAVAHNNDSLNLKVYWSADGKNHVKQLLVPVPSQNAPTGSEIVANIQSFGLPEAKVADEARMIVSRYKVPVTLEDVNVDTPVRINAANETATQTLTRNLKPLGLSVSESESGVFIAPGKTSE